MGKDTVNITIDGIEYIRKDSEDTKINGLDCVIVRTYSAGVFMGYLKSQKGKEVILLKARRIWSWDGAASLSQLAVEGTSKPENCKFPIEVPEVRLTEAIEIIKITAKARASIDSVPVWSK